MTYEEAKEWTQRNKRPHWITHNEGNPFEIYGSCSECGFEQSISNKLNYCPNCGEKMYEAKNDI